MRPVLVKLSLITLAVFSAALIGRYAHVQSQIRNAPIVISEYSESGYTPPGVYGHGSLESETGEFGWYVYDISDAQNGVRKACVNSVPPQLDWDIDFIYADGKWYKLRSGLGRLGSDEFSADPATQKWKGLIPTQLAFPVREPDLPYRLKIIYSKLRYGTWSPLDYLQNLKASNPTCADIPAP